MPHIDSRVGGEAKKLTLKKSGKAGAEPATENTRKAFLVDVPEIISSKTAEHLAEVEGE